MHIQHPGTLYGFHAESSSQTIPLARAARAAGVMYAALLAHENPGLCVDIKAIEPRTLTIARWRHPNDRWEGGQDAANWSATERQDFAQKSIQLIFDRTNDTEYQASDFFCPGLNEWDPPEPGGWGRAALAWKALLDEADRRSPEMTSRGLHPIRLAIPGSSQGTPEYSEMRDVVATGLFTRMKQRGDILLLHEGVWFDQTIDHGYGDLIPGAPSVPNNAGSACGRFNYWYSLGIEVPFVISEFYDGNRREAPNSKRLAALVWYDRLLRRNPWARGFCPFELTDDPDSAWRAVDFTPVFKSPEMLADMVAEKDKPNGVPPAPAKIIDVSRWQGLIDWDRVKAAGVETAIIRATMGATGIDSEYRRNWQGSAAASISHRGIYHYVTASNLVASSQVNNIMQTTGGDWGDEPLTLDCERTDAERLLPVFPKAVYTALVREMLDRLAVHGRVRIYTSANEWQAMTTLPAWAEGTVDWFAEYNDNITVPPTLPPGVRTWKRRQYSFTGRVAGIDANVDLNIDNVAPAPPPTGDDEMTIAQARILLTEAKAKIVAAEAALPLFQVRILADTLNVRAGPAATFTDIGDIHKDEIVEVWKVDTASGWFQIDQSAQKWISGGAAYSVKL